MGALKGGGVWKRGSPPPPPRTQTSWEWAVVKGGFPWPEVQPRAINGLSVCCAPLSLAQDGSLKGVIGKLRREHLQIFTETEKLRNAVAALKRESAALEAQVQLQVAGAMAQAVCRFGAFVFLKALTLAVEPFGVCGCPSKEEGVP